ncbi:hypothetical protein [Bradyrhizobium sp. UFLA05-112]
MTLLDAISRLIRPRAGNVRFMGKAIDQLASHRVVARGLIRAGESLFLAMQIIETLELLHSPNAQEARKTNLDYLLEHFPRLDKRRRRQCKTLAADAGNRCRAHGRAY